MEGALSHVADVIVGALSPHLGPLMARSAVDAHRKKLGLGENLSGSSVEALLEKLRLGLVVFVGPEKAERILLEVRQELAGKVTQ
jgi:hypothetical protein